MGWINRLLQSDNSLAREVRKAGRVAFAGEELAAANLLTLPRRKVRPGQGRGVPPDFPMGPSPPPPASLGLPLPSLEVAPRGSPSVRLGGEGASSRR